MTATDSMPLAGNLEPVRRWVGVGQADGADGTARRALEDAVAGRDPALLILFVSSHLDLPGVLADIRAGTPPSVPVVGCTTSGEIATSGPTDGGLVVVALGGPDFSVASALATNASARLRDAGAEVALAARAIDDRPYQVLLLLTDGLAGDQQEIVRGAYSVVGAQVPLVGGCAGDDLRMESTFVLFGDTVVNDAVVGVAIGSTAPFGIGVRHGWRKVGEPMLVTASVGSRVLTIDDEPALDVYLRRLGAPASASKDAAAFTRYALTHPLGLNRRSGEEVRFIAGADFDERSLQCIAQVPQGGLAWIMEGDDESVLAATDAACADALAQISGNHPLGLLAFDCIARRGVIGDTGIQHEVRRIADSVDGAPVAGFYTYGEIARSTGTGGFHNQTLVVLAVA